MVRLEIRETLQAGVAEGGFTFQYGQIRNQ